MQQKRKRPPSNIWFAKEKCSKKKIWSVWPGNNHRVYTEWQRPLSGVHSITMEKLAQAGEGGVCTPTPSHYIYHQCTHQLRGQILVHSTYFISTPKYSVETRTKLQVGTQFTWKLSSRLSMLSLNPNSTIPVVRTRLRRMSSTLGVKPSSRILNMCLLISY